ADGQGRAIRDAAAPAAAEQSERHADERGRRAREQRELERDREAIEDHAPDRLVLAEVEPEVAARDAREPPYILLRHRLVEVKRLAQRLDPFWRGLVSEHDDRRIPGHEPHEPEDEQAHAKQERDREEQPPRRVNPDRRHQRRMSPGNAAGWAGGPADVAT